MEGWAADGTLKTLHVAFSRDEMSFKGKDYVQNKVCTR
jgi:sulfite reductase alpha subunit-like flavoprotein